MSTDKKWKEWKWSIGDRYEKSPRTKKEKEKEKEKEDENSRYIENIAITAQQQSLLSENDSWAILEETLSMNKREDTYNKMSEREMMCQVSRNPFMTQNSYLDDVMIQEKFLKPISIFVEREK